MLGNILLWLLALIPIWVVGLLVLAVCGGTKEVNKYREIDLAIERAMARQKNPLNHPTDSMGKPIIPDWKKHHQATIPWSMELDRLLRRRRAGYTTP